MAYDLVRGRVVLFGGTPSFFGIPLLGDTWEFVNNIWVQITPATSPSNRLDHAMVYDFNLGQCVMFGGRVSATNIPPLGDTWTWDGINWVQVPGPGPQNRYDHAMSYDIIRQRTVMNGGSIVTNTTPVFQNDTWEFDGNAWHSVANGGLPPKNAHGMAFDLYRSVTVLHGGGIGSSETWEWNGIQWTLVSTYGPAVYDNAVVYDSSIQRITTYAGMSATAPLHLSEVWTFGVPTQGSYIPFGNSCPNGSLQLFEPSTTATGPIIGQTSFLTVAPTFWHTFIVFGWSNTPVDLSSYGMPGCSLLVSRDFTTSMVPSGGASTFPVFIPYDPHFTNISFYVQAFSVDPLANPAWLSATNALHATVGRT
jgi:hypothetical protein